MFFCFKGTSDPVVYVEAFGQKFATEVVKDRLNAVFDETFVINLRNLDQDDFKEGVFRSVIWDAVSFFRTVQNTGGSVVNEAKAGGACWSWSM